MNELDLIDWLRPRLPSREDVLLGAGDDCALLATAGLESLAVTTDTLLEGTHFRPADEPRRVGWKSIAVSLSDLAGMGCAPRWAVTGLGLRRGAPEGWAQGFAEGLIAGAEAAEVALVGGDYTTGTGPTSVTLTAIGSPFSGGPLRRDGARPGDVLVVTGALGGAAAGRHLDVALRLAESRALCATGAVRAMMDLSDGLALDLRRLCRASGVGAAVRAEDVPVHADARAASGGTPLGRALGDGEDFELLAAVRPDRWPAVRRAWDLPTPLTAIGEVTGEAEGLRLIDADGTPRPWPQGGYVHDG